MHWLARVFASAIARRLAYVLVAAVLAWCGMGRANAQDFGTQGAAYSACMSQTAAYLASRGRGANDRNPECNVEQGSQAYRGQFESRDCASCDWFRAYYGYFGWSKGCDQEPDYTGGGPWGTYVGTARSGSIGCRNGCDGVWFGNADDTMTWKALGGMCPKDPPKSCEGMAGYNWNRYLGVCEPTPPEKCPEGQSKNAKGTCEPNACPDGMVLGQDGTCKPKDNECPAGQIKSPMGSCVPGDGQCAKGEVRGKDGTCKRDSDGDGEPDPGEGDGTAEQNFSGGDDCNAPPSCSGDLIMCGQARIQWRIDCNTRKNRNISGGTCAAMPVCTGEKCDAMEYSSLLMQWRTACALERQKAGEGGGGETGIKDHMTAMKQAEVNALRGLGTDDGHAGVDPNGIWAKDADYGEGKISETLFGSGGGSCDLSFTIGGRLVTPPPQFWRICSIIHWLMVAAAYLWVAFKMGG
ncbi:hypothetical protein M0D46_18770 [Xanthomonas prunicola]|uniref:hypothetical protein n=1 Tax=Xanthomonas prunicola TaxID=2053930 RepID=UPI0021B18418|nr:hypothetical protein [Xanthomonas prunicola]UXA69050.1 hypothetical protein M0D46_18770 [Xanthomonas prunicola]